MSLFDKYSKSIASFNPYHNLGSIFGMVMYVAFNIHHPQLPLMVPHTNLHTKNILAYYTNLGRWISVGLF